MNKLIAIILIIISIGCKPNTQEVKITPITIEEVAWVDSEEENELDLLDATVIGRDTEYLVIHCDATYPSNKWTDKDLKHFFKHVRGWGRPGYFLWVDKKGKIYPLMDNNIDGTIEYREISNGVKGRNSYTVHIAYSGGVDKYGEPSDTRTKEQKSAIESIINIYKAAVPSIKVVGHNHFPEVNKACPSFNVEEEYSYLLK